MTTKSGKSTVQKKGGVRNLTVKKETIRDLGVKDPKSVKGGNVDASVFKTTFSWDAVRCVK